MLGQVSNVLSAFQTNLSLTLSIALNVNIHLIYHMCVPKRHLGSFTNWYDNCFFKGQTKDLCWKRQIFLSCNIPFMYIWLDYIPILRDVAMGAWLPPPLLIERFRKAKDDVRMIWKCSGHLLRWTFKPFICYDMAICHAQFEQLSYYNY